MAVFGTTFAVKIKCHSKTLDRFKGKKWVVVVVVMEHTSFSLNVHARKIIQAYSKGDNYLLLHIICHIALINMPAMNHLNISKCIIVMD